MVNPLARKLRRFVHLSDADQLWLGSALSVPQQIQARADIAEQGDDPRAVNVVLDGWAARYKQFADGRRQIIAFLLPGDTCDPHAFLLDRRYDAIGAITPVTLVRIPGSTITEMEARSPVLEEAFRRAALATAAIQQEWTVSLGRRSAIERLAHLLCELHVRLTVIGLAQGPSCPLPLIQTDLADALGQTAVHINRTLKELRNLGLISLRGRCLTIHHRDGLEELAQFDPAYLHVMVERGRADQPIAV